MRLERVQINTEHGEISCLKAPGDPLLVFLHGLGGRGRNWMKLASFFGSRFGIVMPDLPGHGGSTKDLKTWGIEDQVDAMKAFLDTFSSNRKILIGNSYGGWIAMHYTLRYGGIERLILIDSAGTNPTIGENGSKGVEDFIGTVMKNYPGNDPDILGKIIRINSTGTGRLSSSDLMKIKVPALIIWGSDDTIIPVEWAYFLHKNIGGSRLKIIGGAGHIPHYTHPEITYSLISDFLSGV